MLRKLKSRAARSVIGRTLLACALLGLLACAPPTTPSAPPSAATAGSAATTAPAKPTSAPPATTAPAPTAAAAAKPTIVPAAATTAPAAATSAAVAKAPSGEPIKIGLDFAMTIAGATPIAPAVKEGAELMAEQINAKGGVLGRPLQIVTYDNENANEKAVQLARKLIDEDKAIALLTDRTATSAVVAPIAEEAGVLFLELVPTTSVIQGKKWGFQVNPRDETEAQKLFTYLKNTVKVNSVVIIHDENPYGTEGSQEAEKAAQTVGIEIRGKVPYNNNSPDLTAEVTRARSTGAQAVVMWGIPPGPARVLTAAKTIGWSVPMLGSVAVANPAVIQLAGAAAEGMVVTGTFDPSNATGPDKAMLDAYKQKFGQDKTPSSFQGFGWDAVLLLSGAVEKAGSAEPAMVRDALEQLKGVDGVDGTYSMSASDHNGVDPSSLLLLTVKDGKFTGLAQ
jgi:branched-chain amino acid transport system substrate-binding protein